MWTIKDWRTGWRDRSHSWGDIVDAEIEEISSRVLHVNGWRDRSHSWGDIVDAEKEEMSSRVIHVQFSDVVYHLLRGELMHQSVTLARFPEWSELAGDVFLKVIILFHP